MVLTHSEQSTPASEPKPESTGNKEDAEEKKDERTFECNICLDTARNAVVSLCGHLFCWPCLHQWLDTQPNNQVCPVCKAAINSKKVVPLYGRGSTNQQDPRERFPPRPQGQRTEPEPNSHFNAFGFGDNGFHLSFGIGAFPFGFFTSHFNVGGDQRQGTTPRNASQNLEEQYLSKAFLWLAVFFIFWLIYA